VQFAFRQFFEAEIENSNTRRAYLIGAEDFFAFAASRSGGTALQSITSLQVSGWIDDMKARRLSAPTIKQRLAGLRMLFQALVRERILAINPAAVVKGPRHSFTKGKTPVLSGDEINRLLQCIDTRTLTGLRDRAMISTMAYTFARITAVAALRVGDVFTQHRRLWLRLNDKGGKAHDIPCHHVLEASIGDWLDAAGHLGRPDAPLFQTIDRSGRRPVDGWPISGRPMTQSLAWEMVQRRAKDAGIGTRVCNHTFRAAGITAYLTHGGTIERAAVIAGHSSTRTTQLYDRRPDDVTLAEINKIRFA
jgi:site-specific recombinase XerD